jgi:hypothetical protein
MAYSPIQPYVKGQQGSMPESYQRYLEEELKKLQRTIADLLIVIAQIQSKVAYP